MTSLIDETHDPSRRSWLDSANGHPDFPIQNLPLGVFANADGVRGGVAIGDAIVDLAALANSGLVTGPAQQAAIAASGDSLNPLLALGTGPRAALRRALSRLLSDASAEAAMRPLLVAAAEVEMQLPARIGDYTDFYVGIHHATNVGKLFRPDNPLLPNYKYVPIGYHGRASSVRASGAPVPRPLGQRMPPGASAPVFGPCARLDYELELGLWIGPGNDLGEPIAIGQAGSHIAGLSLLNDWSARDLQAWEYQPLGPFLAKNFLTTVSPWIVTAEALAPFRSAQPARPEGDPTPLPHLLDPGDQAGGGLAIKLEAWLQSQRMREAGTPAMRLSQGSSEQAMYWTPAQLVAHHSSNGCNLAPGDLLGTGTLSTASPEGYGSLLELSRGGAEPLTLPDGEQRRFLEDGDELTLVGRCEAEGFVSIGFGPCRGVVQAARNV